MSDENITAQLDQLRRRNHALATALEQASNQLKEAREKMAFLAQPPLNRATFVRIDSDHKVEGVRRTSAEVVLHNRHIIVAVAHGVNPMTLRAGQRVLLDENMRLVRADDFPVTGKMLTICQVLDASRLVVKDSAGNRTIVRRAHQLVRESVDRDDTVLVDDSGEFALSLVHTDKAQELLLEEYPDVSFDDIGGLDKQIRLVRDALQLPFSYPDLYEFFGLKGAQGILLYGPPGNGKTLVAKAIAHELSSSQSSRHGAFLSIKGPEVLSKFVGEAERMIRMVFARAREIAATGKPVVIFIDEMDSLLRTRGSGVSSDMETTVVPQFLTELDGMEDLKNVIVIAASNRLDMIDPAVLRPGRLDLKIAIGAPSDNAAHSIMRHYVDEHMVAGNTSKEELVSLAIADIFSDNRRIAQAHWADTARSTTIFMRDLISGARIKNIVDRAKMIAIKKSIECDQHDTSRVLLDRGIMAAAIDEEYDDLYHTCAHTSVDGWNLLLDATSRTIIAVSMCDEYERPANEK